MRHRKNWDDTQLAPPSSVKPMLTWNELWRKDENGRYLPGTPLPPKHRENTYRDEAMTDWYTGARDHLLAYWFGAGWYRLTSVNGRNRVVRVVG